MLRSLQTSSGMQASWPHFFDYSATSRPTHRTILSAVHWFTLAGLLALGLWTFRFFSGQSLMADEPTSPSPAWPSVWGARLLFSSLSIACVNFAFIVGWLRLARASLEIAPSRLVYRLKWLGLGPRATMDRARCEWAREPLPPAGDGFIIRDGQRLLAFGQGLSDEEKNELQALLKTSLPVYPRCDAAHPPLRIKRDDSWNRNSLTILGRATGLLSRRPARSIFLFMAPTFIVLMVGAGLLAWSADHDPAVLARKARFGVSANPGDFLGSVWMRILTVLGAATTLYVKIRSNRELNRRTHVRLGAESLTLQKSARKAEMIRRDDVQGIACVPSASSHLLGFKRLELKGSSQHGTIHPMLRPHEAEWLAGWIQKNWPEVPRSGAC